jgi:acetyl-CoA carboxylase carboxyltransferase component
VQERSPDLSRISDAHVMPEGDVARGPLRALRPLERLRLLGDEGSLQEAIGVIRHGAKLLHGFAEATVPRFTVVLRKAFGGAYITMNSKGLGADLVLAWARAELGIMGAEQAVGVVHRRALAAAGDPTQERRRLAGAYAAEHLSAAAAARVGAIDAVIRPAETRERPGWALSTLTRARREVPVRNIPL